MITGKSLLPTASIANLPIPGQEKIVSITKDPHTSPAILIPASVMIGRRQFFSTCRNNTLRFPVPLAIAVRT